MSSSAKTVIVTLEEATRRIDFWKARRTSATTNQGKVNAKRLEDFWVNLVNSMRAAGVTSTTVTER